MPAAAFATGERVDAVVSDDVETGVAFNDVSHAGSSALDPFGANPKVTFAMPGG